LPSLASHRRAWRGKEADFLGSYRREEGSTAGIFVVAFNIMAIVAILGVGELSPGVGRGDSRK